jgi:hypothetical protein
MDSTIASSAFEFSGAPAELNAGRALTPISNPANTNPEHTVSNNVTMRNFEWFVFMTISFVWVYALIR